MHIRVKGIAVFLICLICVLSLLDAPEYIRCRDIDLCEFLEIYAHLDNLHKSDLMMYLSHIPRSNFFSMLEGIVSNKDLIQDLILLCMLLILSPFKISCDIIKKEGLFSEGIAHARLLIEDILIFQNLEFIKTAVIRS